MLQLQMLETVVNSSSYFDNKIFLLYFCNLHSNGYVITMVRKHMLTLRHAVVSYKPMHNAI